VFYFLSTEYINECLENPWKTSVSKPVLKNDSWLMTSINQQSWRWVSQHLMCSKERGSLDLTDANGVWALFTLTDFKCDGITVGDFSGYFGDVDEEVIATFDLNKSVSFYLVKPLDSSLRHGRGLCFKYLM